MKPTLTKGGRALLMKALAAIKKHPETFDMDIYMSHDETVKGKRPYCGTVGCLAGHIVLAAGVPPVDESTLRLKDIPAKIRRVAKPMSDGDRVHIGGLACKLVTGEAYDDGLRSVFRSFSCRTPAKIERRVHRWLKTGR